MGIQHIIKKLNIKPNQKVLDIGCGWGSLAIDIAKSASCEVTGITLSENQFNFCKKKAKELFTVPTIPFLIRQMWFVVILSMACKMSKTWKESGLLLKNSMFH